MIGGVVTVVTVEMQRLECGCFPMYMMTRKSLLRTCRHGTVEVSTEVRRKAALAAWKESLRKLGCAKI
jgi:hypothetical protein